MNIDQLRTFCTVAKTLSFTEAAKMLTISQPAVSRQIAALEEEIGAQLFIRGNNTLMLTKAGNLLDEELPGRLSELEKVFFNAKLIAMGKLRRIKIGVLRDQCPDEKLLSVCQSMRLDNYYVRIQQYDFKSIENAVLQKDIDVAVSLCWIPNAFAGCEAMIYRREALCLAVNTEFSPEIPTNMDKAALNEFSKERPTMIPSIENFQKGQHQKIAEVTSKLWNGVAEEDLDVIIPMVQSGIGSALVNSGHILSCDKSVLLRAIDFLEPVEKGVFWLRENPNDAVKDFVMRMK